MSDSFARVSLKPKRNFSGDIDPFAGINGISSLVGDIYTNNLTREKFEWNGTAWVSTFTTTSGDIRGDTIGVIDQEQVGDTDAEWYFKSNLAALELWSKGSGGEFRWLSIGDPEEGLTIHGSYTIRAAGFEGSEFNGGLFTGGFDGPLSFGGTPVVGAQGAAVADATDATSVILRLNELLARLRAHGLIAT